MLTESKWWSVLNWCVSPPAGDQTVCVFQAGKVRKQVVCEEGLGSNIKSLVSVLLLLLLLMFTVHCTWVTSNAYSSPSVVLASYNHDGYHHTHLNTHTHTHAHLLIHPPCVFPSARATSWMISERRTIGCGSTPPNTHASWAGGIMGIRSQAWPTEPR